MAYSTSAAVGIESVRVRIEFLALFAWLGAMVVRVLTLDQYLIQVDEPASLLAIQLVAEHGVPIFPSGVLYLQGSVLSYLAAPLAWFLDPGSLLHAVRLLNIALSSLVVPISMKLVYRVSGSNWASVLTGFLVVCDPNLMIWSVAIRPYGLLAVETMALMYCFVRLMEEGADARIGTLPVVVWLPLLSFAGTFTHIGYWLAVPALGGIALMVWRGSLLTSQRNILFSGMASLLPLLLFLVLGRMVGIGSGTGTADRGVGSSFAGSHLFDIDKWRDGPKVYWHMWLDNFDQGMFHAGIPFLIAIFSGVLLVRALESAERHTGPALAAIVGVHWSVISIVIVFVTSDPATRYVNQILPLGYVVAGVAVSVLWSTADRHVSVNAWAWRTVVVLVMVMPMGLNAVSAANWRTHFPGGDPNYWAANEWLATHYEPGQAVITTLPPASYFWFGGEELEQDFLFLAGPANSDRSLRYTKILEDGTEGDYWLGIPSLASESMLCAALVDHAGAAWILVDWGRLDAPWAFRGAMSTIVRGSSDVRYTGDNGVLALFVRPVDSWTRGSIEDCGL